ncbi:MAG: cysteine synthase family protein [Chloroflexi bacterium]|nr:cysteine synthase family protein [Chloroflexota bacterium]
MSRTILEGSGPRTRGPAASVLEAIGDTPIVELSRLNDNPNVRLFAKLEGANPSGSVKDRIARYLVEEFESRANSSDYILLEPTSGNTGIALAMVSRVKGYRVVAVMPSNVTPERRKLLEIFGAEIIDSPAEKGTNGSIELARELDRNPHYWILNQYANQANPRAHYETTAPEILRDVPDVDVFVAGLGTGGTLTGVGRRLKEERPDVKIVAAEPLPGDLVQGLRSLDEGFVPPIFDPSVLDAKFLVNSADSITMMRRLAAEEGIFAGVSSGAIVAAALRYAERMREGNVVVLLPDGGWKYLSGDLWTEDVANLEEGLEGSFLW